MRIVVTSDCFLPRWDGIARFLSELLPELAKSAQVTVFAPRFEGRFPVFKGVRVVRFPLTGGMYGDIRFCKPDRSVMEKHIRDADVVFNQTVGPVGMASISIASKLKKPVVSYVHSIDWELARKAMNRFQWLAAWFVKRVTRYYYNKCSLILVPSREVSDLLSQNKIKTKKEIVRMGVPISKFVPPRSKAVAKSKVNIPTVKRVVGFCGRIAREKDLPTLYAAVEKIRKDFKNVILLLVGSGLDVPKEKYIVHVGHQDNVVPFLQAMDIFVLPSLTETSSLATMEAMACGLPVVVTPVGSIKEYIVNNENGLLFDRQDVSGLVDDLRSLLKNPKLMVKVGKNARKTIVSDYSWEASVKKIKDVLSTFSG